MSLQLPVRLGIVTALKEELAAIRRALPDVSGEQLRLLRGGVGPISAARAAEQLLKATPPPTVLCSSGFCGGLCDGVDVGDVIVADCIIAPDASVARTIVDAQLVAAMRAALSEAKIRFHVGGIAGSASAVTGCDAKRALGQSCKAVAVDMETAAVARVASAAGVPVIALRVISDSVLDELPAEVGGFLNEEGNVRVGNVARFALRSPRNMKTLWQLKSRTDKAVASLSAAWKAVWPALQKNI
jgi:adenosylhomocysteine nucleosidase